MIYSPAEDSYLIEEQVKKFSKNKSVLDMGSGSGILAESALSSGAKSVLATDINPEVIKLLKKKKIQGVQSNLFEKVSGKFDLIVFNPPYLPEDEKEDEESSLITSGGKRGDELIIDFLNQAKNHLSKEGRILLLLSSLTPRTGINRLINQIRLSKRVLSSKKLFMETLEVWEIFPKNNNQ